MRLRKVITAGIATLTLTACTDYADYDERLNYLRKVAQRGAETHAFLLSQETTVDKARCERAYEGIDIDEDAPEIQWSGNELENWRKQIKEFFVDSCVSGKPKPVPGDPVPSVPPSTVQAPPAPSSS